MSRKKTTVDASDQFLVEGIARGIAERGNRAMSAYAAILVVRDQFERWPAEDKGKVFRTNPMNNPLARLLADAVDSAIVYVRETISSLGIDPKRVHAWQALSNLRHIISHPATFEFERRQVQEFFDKDLHLIDSKIVRLWGALSSIKEWLKGMNYDETMAQPRLIASEDLIDAAWAMLRHALHDPSSIDRSDMEQHIAKGFPRWEPQLQKMFEEEQISGVLRGERLLGQRPDWRKRLRERLKELVESKKSTL